MARADGGLRWTEVTIDSGDNAKDALDRVTFPQEVVDRIAPTAVPGSSITISDEPLSSETNYRTEFVVVLNNQPQGGFANRARSPDMRIARRNTEDNGFGLVAWAIGSPPHSAINPPTAISPPTATSAVPAASRTIGSSRMGQQQLLAGVYPGRSGAG